jgi:polysaccharide deacetylase family protein (PEP-CTERM system associated)
MLNALTIDVEDYYQVSGFERFVERSQWDRYESRVVENTRRVLRLLDEQQVPATFFILGWVAERFPQLVRDIQQAGHEIGSHSYWHRLVYQLTSDEFREDLVRSRDVLEQIIGQRVTAYRAPSFSITKDSLWALDILASEGFLSDSSIYPIYHDRYGIPDAQPGLHRIATRAGDLWEFPASVRRVAGMNVPVSGGGYFRLYPLWLTRRALKNINHVVKRPFVF